MSQRLKNRFFPDTHKKKDVINKIKKQEYNDVFTEAILPDNTKSVPLLALSDYSILLGYIEDGNFAGWIDKKQRATLKANPTYPENPIIELILNSVNIYPAPETILDRIIERLIHIRNSKKRNME